jgi:hypothetical protein
MPDKSQICFFLHQLRSIKSNQNISCSREQKLCRIQCLNSLCASPAFIVQLYAINVAEQTHSTCIRKLCSQQFKLIYQKNEVTP